MSYSIGAMAQGLARGQDQVFSDRRNRAQDQRADERHNMSIQMNQQSMDQRDQDSSWAKQVRERQLGQWKQGDMEQKSQEAIRNAMLQAEVSGDVGGLVKAYNEATGGLIQNYEPTDKGFRFVDMEGNETTLAREEIMGFGASLLQPGALTQVRQAADQRRAEAARAQQERQFDAEQNRLKEGEWATDAEGNREFRMPGQSYTPAPEQSGSEIPAEVRTNRYYADVMGVTEAEAFEIRNSMRGKTPQDAIMDIAEMISSNPRASRNMSVDDIMKQASEVYEGMQSGPANPSAAAQPGRTRDNPLNGADLGDDQPPPDGSFVQFQGDPQFQDGLYFFQNGELRLVQ